MPAPDLLIRAHQLAQIDNGALAASMVMELFTEFQRGSLSRDELITALVGTDMLTHNEAVALARQFIADMRDAEGVDGELVDAIFDADASFRRAVGTLADIDQARSRLPVDRDYDAEFWRIAQGLAVRADRAAKMGGRETVMASAEASGRRWRRVSDGNPCSFCAMLVARGDAYTSEKAALYVVGRGTDTSVNRRADGRRRRGGQAKGVKPRGTRGLGEKFHNNCGCTVVEQIGAWMPTAEEQRYIDLYNASAGGDVSEVLAWMRAGGHGVVNDAHVPKTQAGGSGGGDGGGSGTRGISWRDGGDGRRIPVLRELAVAASDGQAATIFEVDKAYAEQMAKDLRTVSDSSFFGKQVTLFTAEELRAFERLYTSADGRAGGGLKVTGEIAALYSNDGPKRSGERIVRQAVEDGGTYLECFDTYLPGIYSKAGMAPAAAIPFNREYAPEGWDYGGFAAAGYNGGEPDILFMIRGGAPIPVRRFEDYDEAESYARRLAERRHPDA